MSEKWLSLGIGLGSLFNLYAYYLVSTIFKAFAYADYLVLLQEEFNSRHDHIFTLSPDLKDELSHSKTVTAAFHFNKRKAKPELKVHDTMCFYYSL